MLEVKKTVYSILLYYRYNISKKNPFIWFPPLLTHTYIVLAKCICFGNAIYLMLWIWSSEKQKNTRESCNIYVINEYHSIYEAWRCHNFKFAYLNEQPVKSWISIAAFKLNKTESKFSPRLRANQIWIFTIQFKFPVL